MATKDLSRRAFLSTTAAASLGACAPKVEQRDDSTPPVAQTMGRRVLGKSGVEVSMLGFGGGARFLAAPEGEWQQLLQDAVDGGVTYFDNAYAYATDDGSLHSEERFREVLAPHRGSIVLATKINARDPTVGLEGFEKSLERLGTDHVDIVYLHNIQPTDSLTHIAAGIYPAMQKLKDEGSAKLIGVSAMDSDEVTAELIRELDFDVGLFAFNPTLWANMHATAIPEARKKNMGIIAMKVMFQLVGQAASAEELLGYAWSEPDVACALIGHDGTAVLHDNVGIAKRYQETAWNAPRRRDLEKRLASYAGPHALPWARPGYTDGILT